MRTMAECDTIGGTAIWNEIRPLSAGGGRGRKENDRRMSVEAKLTNDTGFQGLLEKLRTAPELYTLLSVCTKEPYVVCDPETFDDEIALFFEEEDAKKEAARLAGEKIPVGVMRMENRQMLPFYTSLYTMGINALLVFDGGEKTPVQLGDFVRRRKNEDIPEGKVWVENPALHLTALYFLQDARRQPSQQMSQESRELQEELLAHFSKGRYIFPIRKDGKGVPLARLNNGDTYQPIFTDILEFQKFNKEDQLRAVVVDAAKIPQVLAKEAKGVLLNITGINLPLPIRRSAPAAAQTAAGAAATEPQGDAAAAAEPQGHAGTPAAEPQESAGTPAENA